MLIHNKDDIEFVTEFPCFLGHPVFSTRGVYMGSIEATASTPPGSEKPVILRGFSGPKGF